MFIGRDKELTTLNNHYVKKEFAFIPIYGRRRIGKTQLIEEFIKDKRSIFFTAVKGTFRENLTLLSNAVFESDNAPIFADFESALTSIYEKAKKEKLIFVIDEYPYFAESSDSVSSILQKIIDLKFLKTDMMLILLGSSMSFMENQVLGYQSPLYGRRSGQIKLLPLRFDKAKLFTPHYSAKEQAVIYGVTGGIPKYLSLFDDSFSLDENIRTQFFDKDYFLFEEADNLLKQELSEPALYKAIITSIATGCSQMKDICAKTGTESSVCSTYMKSLLALGIVTREVPVMDKPVSRKSIYRLSDGMFRFWYRFVYPNTSMINIDRGSLVYERIKPQISDFMGAVFEKICMEYMWSKYDDLPFGFQDIGRWWGSNPLTKSQQEIDFIAVSADKKQAYFGECKWTNELLSQSVITNLIEKSKMFGFDEKYYCFFSKTGFSDAALRLKSDHILLFEFSEVASGQNSQS